ncbi:MAG TPA: hypothetical protein VKR58_15390 [Aquella sp.]|nr:hypothetical protein [Aquella sp.]
MKTTISLYDLKKVSACSMGKDAFLEVFPSGEVEVTEENVLKFLKHQDSEIWFSHCTDFLIWLLFDFDYITPKEYEDSVLFAKAFMRNWKEYGMV